MRHVATLALLLALTAGAAAWYAPDRARDLLPPALAEFLPGGADAGDGSGSAGGQRATPVRLAEVAVRPAVERFETSGEVRAAEQVILRAEIAGRVGEVLAEDGAQLPGGAAILRFAADAEQAAVEAARAARDEAQASLARAETLFAEDVAAEERVETARAALDAARADLTAAKARLSELTVRAPFPGAIGLIDPDPGSFLNPGDRIAAFARADGLTVRFALPIEAARRARRAERVTVVTEDGRSVDATIATVSPLNDSVSRTRRFEARLPRGTGLAPGAFVTVSVPVARREGAVFVPQEALRREGFTAEVFRAEETGDGLVARLVTVEPGVIAPDGTVEIREGLAAGDRVVSSGLQKVSDGAPIRPVEGRSADDGDGEAASGPDPAAADGAAAAATPQGDGDAGDATR